MANALVTVETPAPTVRTAMVLLAFVVLGLLLGSALVAGRIARDRAAAELSDRATAALPLATASLAALIGKQRLVPMVLARDPEVIALLAAPVDHARELLDYKLAEIAAGADAAETRNATPASWTTAPIPSCAGDFGMAIPSPTGRPASAGRADRKRIARSGRDAAAAG